MCIAKTPGAQHVAAELGEDQACPPSWAVIMLTCRAAPGVSGVSCREWGATGWVLTRRMAMGDTQDAYTNSKHVLVWVSMSK